jgi:hypothetical protein
MLNGLRQRIGHLSLAAKIPAICQFRQSVIENGCLASYGITIPELYVLSASQIANLLQGAKPENLPVQQPTKFERGEPEECDGARPHNSAGVTLPSRRDGRMSKMNIPLGVDLSRRIVIPRMAGIGASAPLASVPARVRLLNR